MPNPYATGFPDVRSSLLFGGADFANLGQPAALAAALAAGHEFTVLVRTSRVAVANTGVVVGRGDGTNTDFSITSAGGNAWSLNVGGTSFTTGSGTTAGSVWDSIVLVNRDSGGGVFKARAVLNSGAATAEQTSGAQSSGRDVMVGARRGSSNSDSANKYTGWVGTIAIWNRALTDDEAHYAMGLLTPTEMLSTLCPSGLVAYFPCSERGGTTLHDVVGGLTASLTSDVFTTSAYPKPPIVAIGDSLANGSGSQTGKPWCLQAVSGGSGARNMRASMAYGFSGQNNAYVLSQIQLSSFAPFFSWTPIFQPGAHDLGNSTVVAANVSWLASTAALFPHGRWLVLGQRCDGVGSSGVGDPTAAGAMDYGTTRRAQHDAQEYGIRAFGGSRWVDTMNLAVSLATLPAEAHDVAQLRTPVHLCSDAVHPRDEFLIALSAAVDARLNMFGW